MRVEKEEWKLDTLCDLYETLTITQAVIFCNLRRKVEWLTDMMHRRDFTVSAMVRTPLSGMGLLWIMVFTVQGWGFASYVLWRVYALTFSNMAMYLSRVRLDVGL